MDLSVTAKQWSFINATADEVLFGGAAGGGKSYAQVIDALLYALRYPRSKQIVFRRTYVELEKSIIRTMLSVYPIDMYTYNSTKRVFTFSNGSIIDCGYIAQDTDVHQYQSSEYDCIRFDELTHFSEYSYTYMLSRLRGTNGYPKSMRSATNPTGVGRVWVKERFVDIGEWGSVVTIQSPCGSGTSTRLFIPSKVQDNVFLMKSDPEYLLRLAALPEAERRGLLLGEWDFFEGQYFDEFRRSLHTATPFRIPEHWRKYRAIDYGLDMLACYWIAVDTLGRAYVYRELCCSNLPIGEAAKRILQATPVGEKIYTTLAPPDLWSRSQETGRSKAAIFQENGLVLTVSSNDREAGWLAVKELLREAADGKPRVVIFSCCTELIRCLPALQRDRINCTDCATVPHDITHAPDALRYFAVYWTSPAPMESPRLPDNLRQDILDDYRHADAEGKQRILEKYVRKGSVK